MKALVFDGQLRLADDQPQPVPRPGWALIRVLQAGICRTDLEITRGYMGFSGVLGHEFVGRVEACDDNSWMGARVVGEINAACGTCAACAQGMGRHCPDRLTLGILGLDGCMAEYCALPASNLHRVPEDVADDAAVFVEPLSAAFEILDQVPVGRQDRCVVLGDGKLGILCAWALATASDDVTLIGHHPDHLKRARWGGVRTTDSSPEVAAGADIVVEATGSTKGLADSIRLCRPRGTLVLKSTLASGGELNLAPVVINELTVVGSRCGRFDHGLQALRKERMPVERLIDARYPLADGPAAFERARQPGVLKVLLVPAGS